MASPAMSVKQIVLLVVGGALVLLPEPVTTATGTALGLAVIGGMVGISGVA